MDNFQLFRRDAFGIQHWILSDDKEMSLAGGINHHRPLREILMGQHDLVLSSLPQGDLEVFIKESLLTFELTNKYKCATPIPL